MLGNHSVAAAGQEMTYFLINVQILHVSAVFKPGLAFQDLTSSSKLGLIVWRVSRH